MSTIIHVELDVLCFLILAVIGYQITRSVSKQMNRVLFRTLIYGIKFSLALDIAWVLTEGRLFPGAVAVNKLIDALYLGVGVILGCIWYLYVLETLGYKITPADDIPCDASGRDLPGAEYHFHMDRLDLYRNSGKQLCPWPVVPCV